MTVEPQARETGGAGPALTVGAVTVWALGEERFRIESPQGHRHVRGYKLARVIAYEIAERLDSPSASRRPPG